MQCTFFSLSLATLIILIWKLVSRMFSPCFYFPLLVLVFDHFYVGSPLELFVCLGFHLSSRPPLAFGCNVCGAVLAKIPDDIFHLSKAEM